MGFKISVSLIWLLLLIGGYAADGVREGTSMSETAKEVVNIVDLARYAGVWYEIARLPNDFDRGLVGVTATYTQRRDGKINVLNQG